MLTLLPALMFGNKLSHIWWIQSILLQRQSKAAGGPMKKESISSLTFAPKKMNSKSIRQGLIFYTESNPTEGGVKLSV